MKYKLENLAEEFRKLQEIYYRSQIKITPVNSNRASSLGHPCMRYLVYLRTRWQDQLAPDVDIVKFYIRGREDEKVIIRKLMDMGIEVIEAQRSFYDKTYNIAGTIDAKIKINDEIIPVEIKSLSPAKFNRLNSSDDFKNAREYYIRGYYTQLQIYLYLISHDKQELVRGGGFILENKLNGELKFVGVEIDLDEVEEAIKKAEMIEKYVGKNELPERIDDYRICSKCVFRHICLPDVESQGFDYVDEETTNLAERLYELKKSLQEYEELYAEYEELKNELKEKLKYKIESGTEKILAGDYIINAKKIISKRIDTSKIPPELKSQFQTESVSYRIDIVKLNE